MSIRKGNNIIAGNPSIETVANVDLSNLSSNGKHYIAFKGYDSTTTYSLNDVVVSIQNDEVKIYQSLADINTSPLTDTTKWKEVELGGSIAVDGNTITFNSNNEIQTIGVIDSSNNTIALKLWTGTRAEYDAITTKDSNTLYHIKDDTGELVTFANADLSNLSSTGEAKFQHPITGAATSITSSNLTASKALVSDSNGKVDVSSVTSTELGYVSGVTSSIQTQFDNKQETLVSGTNIKTINGNTILGSGNLAIIQQVSEVPSNPETGVLYVIPES